MSKRKTHEEFLKELNLVNSDIVVLSNYVNNKTKILCRCKNNHTWSARPDHLLNGSGCPECYQMKNKTINIKSKSTKNIGIYSIMNKLNNKIYIGQSVDINKRFIKHRTLLNNNKHNNLHLQQAWNKYGENNFEFSIIEYCEKCDLNGKEKYWINYYNSTNKNNGYNIAIGGSANKGFHHTKESIEKMLISRGYDGNYIVQLDLNNRFLAMWENPNIASKILNVDVRGIYNCINHKNNIKTINEYIWLYLDEYLSVISDS